MRTLRFKHVSTRRSTARVYHAFPFRAHKVNLHLLVIHPSGACGLQAQGKWLQRVTAAWQRGRVSNRDYLLFLNLAAGRSFTT